MKKFILLTILISSLNFKTPSASACGVFTSPVGGGLIAAGISMIVCSPVVGFVGVGFPAHIVTAKTLDAISDAKSTSSRPLMTAMLAIPIGTVIGAVGSITCGVLLLEDETGKKDFEFSQLSLEHAKKLNIEQSQMVVYNENIDELNVLKETVVSHLNLISKERKLTIEDSKDGWKLVANEVEKLGISLSTLSAIVSNSNI